MDSENIDKLFIAIKRGHNKKVWEFADMEINYTTKKWSQYEDEVYSRIMKKIEEGDIEYFLHHTASGRNTYNDKDSDARILTLLVLHSSNTDLYKRVIEYDNHWRYRIKV